MIGPNQLPGLQFKSPLLEFSITGAKGVIFNIVGGKDLSITEVQQAAKVIEDEVHQDCNLVFGASIDPEMEMKSK